VLVNQKLIGKPEVTYVIMSCIILSLVLCTGCMIHTEVIFGERCKVSIRLFCTWMLFSAPLVEITCCLGSFIPDRWAVSGLSTYCTDPVIYSFTNTTLGIPQGLGRAASVL
jgi:hypothetical protein